MTTGAPLMNQSKKKPVKKKDVGKDPALENKLPDDRTILDTIYKHYGTPENIEKEKVKLYKAYRSPAGWSQNDWIEDGFQMGRVTVFVKDDVVEGSFIHRTKIGDEGKGSWFIGVSSTQIKIWISGKLDAVLDVEV